MKNGRKEISLYFEEMPTVFEKYNPRGVEDPNISETLIEKGLRLTTHNIEVGKVICENTDGELFLVKYTSNTEEIMLAKVLPAIEKQDLPFQVLQFPKLAFVVRKNDKDLIFIKQIEGSNFNDKWDEASNFGYGGKGIKPDFTARVVDLLVDLSLINTSFLETFGLLTFDFDRWKKQNLPFLTEILVKRKLIDQEYIDRAVDILSRDDIFKNSRMILTNGDFYPRNLIELPSGKIALVDWEGRQDYAFLDQEESSKQEVIDQRNAFVNFVENHIAFFYIHMWGNPDFQKKFIHSASQRFNLTEEKLQAAILIKSLEQALIWPDDLANIQIDTFVKVLDINSIRDL